MSEQAKVIRDGKVSVAVSPGYGAGWYTWNDRNEQFLFDPAIIAAIEAEDWMAAEVRAKEIEPDACTVGARDLEIAWLDVGAQFRIDEFDGYESLLLRDNDEWITA